MRTAALLLVGLATLALTGGVCHRYEQNYYEAIGCKPETPDQDGCPTSYDCSHLTERDHSKCYYQGQGYDQGSTVEEAQSACLAACRCLSGTGTRGKASFTCARIECPEIFRRPRPGCYSVYSHDKCCRVKEICNDTEEAAPKIEKAVCEFEGKSLLAGQRFYPKDPPCLKCICQAGFDGALVEPYCQKIDCNFELLGKDRIGECVPVQYGDDSCCPIGWRCPKESDSVIPAEAKSGSSSDKTCKFGGLTMHVGDTLSVSDEFKNAECSCRLPPHPICIEQKSTGSK